MGISKLGETSKLRLERGDLGTQIHRGGGVRQNRSLSSAYPSFTEVVGLKKSRFWN